MKRSRWFLFVIFLLTFSAVHAQDHIPLFTPLSDTAVIKRGATEWEKGYSYTDPGAVIYYGGQFHMFRNAFRGWPAPVQIAYMTSPDGVTWTEMSDGPVLTTDDVPFAQQAALASSVLIEDDGT